MRKDLQNDNNVLRYLQSEQQQEKARCLAYLGQRKNFDVPTTSQRITSNNIIRQSSRNRTGYETRSNMLQNLEMEVRTWLGIHDRGHSEQSLNELKRNCIIGGISILTMIGFVVLH